MNGILNFFKPKGMTSHGAVNFMRKKLNMKRIGHTGTLDPNVSGVLPLCIGKATRVSEYLLEGDKEYIGELTLGIATDTQDSEGRVLNHSGKIVSEDDIHSTFNKYVGQVYQVPPMYSALKHKGKKLYELARQGEVVERKKRLVTLYENEILRIHKNKVLFRVKCSKGTYIRTLCDDIGKDLGTFAYMSYLIRTKVDRFNISDSVGKEYIESISVDEVKEYLYPSDYVIKDMKKINLPDNLFFKVSNGMKVNLEEYSLDLDDISNKYRVYCKDKFIGIGEVINLDSKKYLKMQKVLLV